MATKTRAGFVEFNSVTDVRVVLLPDMATSLAANIDGFLASDSICQRAIYDEASFLHILSNEIGSGHPCCYFAASKEFVHQMTNSYAALVSLYRRCDGLCLHAGKP
jgi:ABC-type nitrate/sulfonate/bicarbonate transport system substrate-binding protein